MNVVVVFEVIPVAPLEVLNAGTPAVSACAHNFAGAGFETRAVECDLTVA